MFGEGSDKTGSNRNNFRGRGDLQDSYGISAKGGGESASQHRSRESFPRKDALGQEEEARKVEIRVLEG